MRTLRAPDLSKVHLGAGGEKLKILASMLVLEIDFFDRGNFRIFPEQGSPLVGGPLALRPYRSREAR